MIHIFYVIDYNLTFSLAEITVILFKSNSDLFVRNAGR